MFLLGIDMLEILIAFLFLLFFTHLLHPFRGSVSLLTSFTRCLCLRLCLLLLLLLLSLSFFFFFFLSFN